MENQNPDTIPSVSTHEEAKKSQVHRRLLSNTCTDLQKVRAPRPASTKCGRCRSMKSICDGERPCDTCSAVSDEIRLACIPGRTPIRCQTCRDSHQRCDLQRPDCGRCTERRTDCVWTEKPERSYVRRKKAGAVSDNPAGTNLPSYDIATNTINETQGSGEQTSTGGSRGSLVMIQAATTQDREQSEGQQSDGQQSYGEQSDGDSEGSGKDPAGRLNWGDPRDFNKRHNI